MRSGEIVEQGSHAELMQMPGGAYATLVRLQTSTQQDYQNAEYSSPQKLKGDSKPEVVQAYSTSQVPQVLLGDYLL